MPTLVSHPQQHLAHDILLIFPVFHVKSDKTVYENLPLSLGLA